jgi:hypothetical protein
MDIKLRRKELLDFLQGAKRLKTSKDDYIHFDFREKTLLITAYGGGDFAFELQHSIPIEYECDYFIILQLTQLVKFLSQVKDEFVTFSFDDDKSPAKIKSNNSYLTLIKQGSSIRDYKKDFKITDEKIEKESISIDDLRLVIKHIIKNIPTSIETHFKYTFKCLYLEVSENGNVYLATNGFSLARLTVKKDLNKELGEIKHVIYIHKSFVKFLDSFFTSDINLDREIVDKDKQFMGKIIFHKDNLRLTIKSEYGTINHDRVITKKYDYDVELNHKELKSILKNQVLGITGLAYKFKFSFLDDVLTIKYVDSVDNIIITSNTMPFSLIDIADDRPFNFDISISVDNILNIIDSIDSKMIRLSYNVKDAMLSIIPIDDITKEVRQDLIFAAKALRDEKEKDSTDNNNNN